MGNKSGSVGTIGPAPVVALAALVGALACVFAGPATASPTMATHTYAASTEVIANPDRGFYHYTETHFGAGGAGYAPLAAGSLVRWRQDEGVTLVYRIVYLEGLRTTDDVDPVLLDLLAKDFETARSAGAKLVLRFAYSDGSGSVAPPYGDVPVDRAISHIRQLAPVLNRNADVIEVLQAGFVGLWGEWYYTDHFAQDPKQPWLLGETDWANRGRLLRTLLDATGPSIFVQVRYPAIKQRLLPAGDPQADRVGVHNDCFLASADDYGTFASGTADKEWLAAESTRTPVGGETCQVNAPRSGWSSAEADMKRYHWSFLNADYHRDVLGSWGGAALAEAGRRLGYRLRLDTAELPQQARPGAAVAVTLRLVNDGYAAPFRRRPVVLVMQSDSARFEATLPSDVRTWQPGAVALATRVCAPKRAGTYRTYLSLPDPAAAASSLLPLAGRDEATRVAYAVRLANVGTWDAAHGLNDLGHSLRVASQASPSGACTITPRRVA